MEKHSFLNILKLKFQKLKAPSALLLISLSLRIYTTSENLMKIRQLNLFLDLLRKRLPIALPKFPPINFELINSLQNIN